MSDAVRPADVVAWLRAFAGAVAREREHLTELDAAIGDADHGINMERGMRAVAARLDEPAAAPGGSAAGEVVPRGVADAAAAPAGVGALLKTVGMTLVSTVGGAAGPLYGTLFLEMGKAAGGASGCAAGDEDADADSRAATAQWASLLEAGVAGVRARGKAEPGDKTMLDALVPAAEALRAAAEAGLAPGVALRRAADAAERGMRATVPLIARKGRASYLGERSVGHQDPGATSSWLLLEAAAETLAAEAPSTESPVTHEAAAEPPPAGQREAEP